MYIQSFLFVLCFLLADFHDGIIVFDHFYLPPSKMRLLFYISSRNTYFDVAWILSGPSILLPRKVQGKGQREVIIWILSLQKCFIVPDYLGVYRQSYCDCETTKKTDVKAEEITWVSPCTFRAQATLWSWYARIRCSHVVGFKGSFVISSY